MTSSKGDKGTGLLTTSEMLSTTPSPCHVSLSYLQQMGKLAKIMLITKENQVEDRMGLN